MLYLLFALRLIVGFWEWIGLCLLLILCVGGLSGLANFVLGFIGRFCLLVGRDIKNTETNSKIDKTLIVKRNDYKI